MKENMKHFHWQYSNDVAKARGLKGTSTLKSQS